MKKRLPCNVLTKTGISYLSTEGARGNLNQDIPDWNFERVRRSAWSLWNKALSCITMEGATETQRTIFNTALYHTMIDPRDVRDADGKYVGADKKTHSSTQYTQRTVFSGWDVYRAEFPLMTILRPGVINDEINTLVDLAESSGRGYLERWEIMNAYSGCMDGDPGISVILDAYAKGMDYSWGDHGRRNVGVHHGAGAELQVGNIGESSFRRAFLGLVLGPAHKAVLLQVMAIIGGAVLPTITGRISDPPNFRTAFIIPLVCYLFIFYFVVNGYRPGNARREDAPSTARMAQES